MPSRALGIDATGEERPAVCGYRDSSVSAYSRAAALHASDGAASRRSGIILWVQRRTMTTNDDRTALDALSRQDEAGLRDLFDRYGPWVYGIAYRMLGSHQDAEEATQDVFVKLWGRCDQWDEGRGGFRSWFAQVARRTVIDAARRRVRLVENPYPSDDDAGIIGRHTDTRPLPDVLAELSETRTLIEESLQRVTRPQHRIAWALRHPEGMSLGEIASLLGRRPSTIKIWVFRGNRELAQILARRGFGFGMFLDECDETPETAALSTQ